MKGREGKGGQGRVTVRVTVKVTIRVRVSLKLVWCNVTE